MKLYNVKSAEDLFDTVKKCKGKVELVTESGLYNLKSTLSQILAYAKVFSGQTIKEIELKLADPMDCQNFIQFCLNE